MSNAENGARIKAFAGSGVGSGIVKNITFQNFAETNVDSPVVVDQCYETSDSDCASYPSNVYISDIYFTNITGTSSGKKKGVVASLDCSPGSRCSDINVAQLGIKWVLLQLKMSRVLMGLRQQSTGQVQLDVRVREHGAVGKRSGSLRQMYNYMMIICSMCANLEKLWSCVE
jgi:polygalacturonase